MKQPGLLRALSDGQGLNSSHLGYTLKLQAEFTSTALTKLGENYRVLLSQKNPSEAEKTELVNLIEKLFANMARKNRELNL
jgi:uncharacterized protein YecE (DUF72 family)